MTRQNRIDRLRKAYGSDGIDAVIVAKPADISYFTGFPASPDRPSFLVVSDERAVVVAPGSEDQIRRFIQIETDVIGYPVPGVAIDFVAETSELSTIALRQALELAGLGRARVGYDETQMRLRHVATVHENGIPIPVESYGEIARRIKDADELKLIQAAITLNDIGFRAAQETIRPGISEMAIQGAIVEAMQNRSGVLIDILDDTNCLISGPRTEDGVGLATTRRLEAGDLVVIDLNPFIHAYKGDTTRTFSVGEPSKECRSRFEILAQALEAGEVALRPGTSGREIYRSLIRPILEAGYTAGLTGHGGHAIGLEHLERPYIIPGEDLPVEAGMVITLEPGIYLRGQGGMRLEDDYLITAQGPTLLSHFPRELIVCD